MRKTQVKCKKRIEWIDYLKAIGIFLVSLGHSNCNLTLRKYIYSFHMPLFFILGGITFNPNKYKGIIECIKDKTKKLLLPYLCINIFTIPFYYIYCNYIGNKTFDIVQIIKGLLIGNNDIVILVNGPTWFILTLFLGEILFFILYKIFRGDKKHLLNTSILLIIIGYVESITSGNLLMPWHINSVPVGCALIIIGYLAYGYIRENEEKIKEINILVAIGLIIIGAYIAIWINGKVSFGGNNYKSIILTFSSLFCTIAGITLFLMKIKKFGILSFIGRNSLIILAIHKPIILILRYFIPGFKTQSWFSTILGVLMFICLLPITYLIDKFMPFLVGNLNKYNKVGKKAIYALMALIIIMFSILCVRDNMNIISYKKFISNQQYVAHALGGIDGFAYTNSKEALENAYNNGFRIFEADIKLTSDNQLVCVHGWSKKDYEERLGIEYNEKNLVMDYNTFMNLKIQGKYTPLSFKKLAEFIGQHEDMYVMIDIGNKSYEETKEIYTKIIEDCNYNDNILQRLIVGGHTTGMIKAVKECYDFDIINLYWAAKDKREEEINTKEEFVEYCKKYGISSLSLSASRYTEEFGEYMQKNNMIVYVFTENDENVAKEILKNADLVGTDFIK